MPTPGDRSPDPLPPPDDLPIPVAPFPDPGRPPDPAAVRGYAAGQLLALAGLALIALPLLPLLLVVVIWIRLADRRR